jgi:hypothetical protein
MKVIVKTIAGSHLFGLNTPKSDKDYKGIYLPEPRDIILEKVKKSIHESTGDDLGKNDKDDVDIEFYSLCKFFKMLQEGQTVAIEMLFTPEHQILEKSPIWDEIVSMRNLLVHKKVTAFIGYAKTQADKYGIKGARMATLKSAMELLNSFTGDDKEKLWIFWNDITDFANKTEHSSMMDLPVNKNMQNKTVEHWEICGRKFDSSNSVYYVYNILRKIYNEYGQRAIQAEKNDGVDWKAVSHAIRVCSQGIELLDTGKITLPIPEPHRSLILDVKQGKLDFKAQVQPFIEEYMAKLLKKEKESNLRESLSNEFIDDLIFGYYYARILEGENNGT